MKNGRIYEAKVEEVHSGDDFIVMVNLGIGGLFLKTRVRLHGVDAPNAYKSRSDTEAGRVRDEAKQLVNGRCLIEVVSEGKGGWIVNMTIFDESNQPICLNTLMRDRGYVYPSAKPAQ